MFSEMIVDNDSGTTAGERGALQRPVRRA